MDTSAKDADNQVRSILRARHYSPRTEKAYVGWIRRFIVFHGKRHPLGMGEVEVASYLSNLAVQRHVSASTQNQALSALLFMYNEVLGKTLTPIPGLVHAQRPLRLPLVLSRAAVGRLSSVAPLPLSVYPDRGIRIIAASELVASSRSADRV